jgi:hypothetical protein
MSQAVVYPQGTDQTQVTITLVEKLNKTSKQVIVRMSILRLLVIKFGLLFDDYSPFKGDMDAVQVAAKGYFVAKIDYHDDGPTRIVPVIDLALKYPKVFYRKGSNPSKEKPTWTAFGSELRDISVHFQKTQKEISYHINSVRHLFWTPGGILSPEAKELNSKLTKTLADYAAGITNDPAAFPVIFNQLREEYVHVFKYEMHRPSCPTCTM